jgi:hypothetical protein
MVTVAAWLLANPPPASLAQIDGGADGPFRSTDAPLAFRAQGPRRLVKPAPAPPGALVPVLVAPPPKKFEAIAAAGHVVLGAVCGEVAIVEHSLRFAGLAGAMLGLAAWLVTTRSSAQLAPARLTRAASGARRRPRPIVEEIQLSRDQVHLLGAAALHVALLDIRAFDHRPKADELRVKLRGLRSTTWPILWVGPADERTWIEALVKVAIDDARATAPASP